MSKRDEHSAVSPPETSTAPAYTKAQYLVSNRFTPAQRDILAAVLEDAKTYTDAQAREALLAYLKRSVK